MRNKYLNLISVLLMVLTVSACTDDQLTITFKTLKTDKIVYDKTMETAKDMRASGRMTKEQWNDLVKVAEPYALAHNVAVTALLTAKKTQDAKATEIAIQASREAFVFFEKYRNHIMKYMKLPEAN